MKFKNLIGFDRNYFYLTEYPSIRCRSIKELLRSLISKNYSISKDLQEVYFLQEFEILEFEKEIKKEATSAVKNIYQHKIPHSIKEKFEKNVFICEGERGASEIWVKNAKDVGYYQTLKVNPENLTVIARLILNYPDIRPLAESEYMRYYSDTGEKGECDIMPWFTRCLKRYIDTLDRMEVAPFLWLEEESDTPKTHMTTTIFSTKKLEEAIDDNAPLKHWSQILERLSDAETFLSWCWLLFSHHTEATRQIMWIRGNGHDGKTTLSKVISKYLGLQNICAWDLEPNSKNQFTTSKFKNKRLTTNSESHITRILDDKIVFRITGEDLVDIEGKNESSHSGEINTFMLFNANKPPQINTYDPSHVSRLIYLEIKPRAEEIGKNGSRNFIADSSFEDNLISEKYAFLAACKKAYFKTKLLEIKPYDIFEALNFDGNKTNRDKIFQMKFANSRIPITDKTRDLILTHCCDSIYYFFTEFFLKDNFEITKNLQDKINKYSFKKAYECFSKDYGEDSNQNFSKLMGYLLLNGCTLGPKGGEILGIRPKGKDSKPAADDSSLDIPI